MDKRTEMLISPEKFATYKNLYNNKFSTSINKSALKASIYLYIRFPNEILEFM